MNFSVRRIDLLVLASCLTLAVAIAPALAGAQSTSSGASSKTAQPTDPTSPTSTAPAPPPTSSGSAAAPRTMTKSGGAASAQDIAAAKASGKVWVNTKSGVYHKGGRYYGKTQEGKFMTEAEAKAAGYKAAQKE